MVFAFSSQTKRTMALLSCDMVQSLPCCLPFRQTLHAFECMCTCARCVARSRLTLRPDESRHQTGGCAAMVWYGRQAGSKRQAAAKHARHTPTNERWHHSCARPAFAKFANDSRNAMPHDAAAPPAAASCSIPVLLASCTRALPRSRSSLMPPLAASPGAPGHRRRMSCH